jgi:RNA polymerase sigma factor (sigma-70 family)
MPKEGKDFIAYYNEFKDKIFNYFLYRLNFNNSVAEDLTSEVFLKAFEKFDTYDQDRPFQAWIYTIARNHLYNYYRILGREVELEDAIPILNYEASKVDINLELEKVMAEIEKMNPYHRDVLLLRYVDGLDNSEIAKVLGKDEGAVRTQIHRALNKLREGFKNI